HRRRTRARKRSSSPRHPLRLFRPGTAGLALRCIGNPYLLFGLSAAFAGPLLELLSIPGIGFHLYGYSTSGKTTILILANSVWFHPKVKTWHSTINSLEGIAADRSGTLIALEPTIPDLAAAYAWGMIRDHPFVDGNKRTALLVADAFCTSNGYRFGAAEEECVIIFQAAAAGEIQEGGLAAWFKRHTKKSRQ